MGALGFGVWGLGIGGLGFGVWGHLSLGFGVQGLVFESHRQHGMWVPEASGGRMGGETSSACVWVCACVCMGWGDAVSEL